MIVGLASLQQCSVNDVQKLTDFCGAVQKAVTECDWGKWCEFLGKMEAKFTGDLRHIFDDFMKIMDDCQKQGGLLRYLPCHNWHPKWRTSPLLMPYSDMEDEG
jgi:hypothetical protein